MKTYSQKEIDDLIATPKVITEPPKQEFRSERGHKRNGMRLQSLNGEQEFTVFMRINEDFPENFSIGLEHSPHDERGTILLLRCNGPHGEFIGQPELPRPHFLHHVHKAGAANLDAGLRAEANAKATDAYASYKEAFRYFLKIIKAANAQEFFPDVYAPLLFSEDEEPKP